MRYVQSVESDIGAESPDVPESLHGPQSNWTSAKSIVWLIPLSESRETVAGISASSVTQPHTNQQRRL